MAARKLVPRLVRGPSSFGVTARRVLSRSRGQVAVQRGDDLRAFANGCTDALERAGTNVADRKDARDAGLERIRRALGREFAAAPAGDHKPGLVDFNPAIGKPGRRRIGADEQEDIADGAARLGAAAPIAP